MKGGEACTQVQAFFVQYVARNKLIHIFVETICMKMYGTRLNIALSLLINPYLR